MIIDSHYAEKHADSITDEIILKLVHQLNNRVVLPQDVKSPYSCFVEDQIELEGKKYKLIWLTEDDRLYIGVINAYRR